MLSRPSFPYKKAIYAHLEYAEPNPVTGGLVFRLPHTRSEWEKKLNAYVTPGKPFFDRLRDRIRERDEFIFHQRHEGSSSRSTSPHMHARTLVDLPFMQRLEADLVARRMHAQQALAETEPVRHSAPTSPPARSKLHNSLLGDVPDDLPLEHRLALSTAARREAANARKLRRAEEAIEREQAALREKDRRLAVLRANLPTSPARKPTSFLHRLGAELQKRAASPDKHGKKKHQPHSHADVAAAGDEDTSARSLQADLMASMEEEREHKAEPKETQTKESKAKARKPTKKPEEKVEVDVDAEAEADAHAEVKANNKAKHKEKDEDKRDAQQNANGDSKASSDSTPNSENKDEDVKAEKTAASDDASATEKNQSKGDSTVSPEQQPHSSPPSSQPPSSTPQA